MKNRFIIVSLLAVILGIGIFQHSRLTGLSEETASLERQLPPPGSVRIRRESPSIEAPIPVSKDEIDFIREHFVSALARSNGYRLTPENRRKMLLIAAKLTAREMEALLPSLLSDSRLAGLSAEKAIEAMLDIFPGTAPAATLEFLQSHREIAHWDGRFSQAFHCLLMMDQSQGIRWFEQQEELGNPDIQNPELRRSFLMTLARIDPDKMLARALSQGFSSDPDTLARLGIYVASTLNQPSERHHFFAALRRTRESKGPSAHLEKIRSDCIRGISGDLADSSFDDAHALVESEFSPDEKLAFAGQVINSPDFIDPEKWANWAIKIDSSAWVEWSKRSKANEDHPAVRILSNWARIDENAAGEWLEKIPAGDLKTTMACEFIASVATVNPDKASTYLALVPEGKSKEDIITKINEVREFHSGDTKERLSDSIRLQLGN